jgi:predicted PurR-regulated permease PerM
MEKSPWGRALIILGVIAVGLYLAGQLLQLASHFADIIILFFLAWLLAFVLLPSVRLLENRFALGRAGAAALVYLVLLVCLVTVLVLVIPLLIEQVTQFSAQLPTLALQVPTVLGQVQDALDRRGIPIAVNLDRSQLGLGQEATQLGTRLVENSVVVASGIASAVFSVTLILILSFYLVLDGDRFVGEVLAAIPERYADDARQVLVSIDRTFGGFMRGVAIQGAILGLGTAAIMGLGGLHYVLLASIFAAVVIVVPFVGPFFALAVPMVIAVFSNLPTSQLIAIVIGLVVLQLLVLNVVAPKVMSESVGLHPLLVFLALLTGVKEAGIAGAIFGVPIAAVIYALARIMLRRWQVIEHGDLAGDVTRSAQPGRVASLPRVARPSVRFDYLGLHVGRAISRLFHARPN